MLESEGLLFECFVYFLLARWLGVLVRLSGIGSEGSNSDRSQNLKLDKCAFCVILRLPLDC